MSTAGDEDRDAKVEAGEAKLQAQSEQKLADMAGNPDLERDAQADADHADRKADSAEN